MNMKPSCNPVSSLLEWVMLMAQKTQRKWRIRAGEKSVFPFILLIVLRGSNQFGFGF